MKDSLVYTTEIPHHDDEDAVLKVSITNYADGPIMFLLSEDNQRISLNRAEINQLSEIMSKYENAKTILEGE